MKRKKIKVACEAVRGRAHEASALPCQDKVFSKRFEKNWVVVALADGAGSAPLSHIGAEYVVQELTNIVFENFDDLSGSASHILKTIVTKLQSGIYSIAEQHNASVNDFACTLLFSSIKSVKRKHIYLAGHIGDGVIIMQERGRSSVLSHPDRGEFANSTFFVTSDSAEKRLRIHTGIAYGDIGFLLVSDGTADSLYRKKDGEIAPACNEIFRWAEIYPTKKFKRILRRNLHSVFREMTRDDCSIALMRTVGIERAPKKEFS